MTEKRIHVQCHMIACDYTAQAYAMISSCILTAMQAGITLVGTSSLLAGEGSSTQDISPQKMLLGMGLIIASQVTHYSLPNLQSLGAVIILRTNTMFRGQCSGACICKV